MRCSSPSCVAGLVDPIRYLELGHVVTSAVATMLTMWGFFLARFPYWDWYGLPVLGTADSAVGAWLEAASVPLTACERGSRPRRTQRSIGCR
jgi:hypothetical protein